MLSTVRQRISDAWIFLKIGLHLPLPFSKHFYKGYRISTKRNWFCASCSAVFDLVPWKQYKHEPAAHLKCPSCQSKSVVWSTFLFMAIVDKKPKEYLHWLLKLKPREIITWISKHKTF